MIDTGFGTTIKGKSIALEIALVIASVLLVYGNTLGMGFVLALVPYGVSESDALAVSIIFHILSYSFVMISGVIALRRLDIRVSELGDE